MNVDRLNYLITILEKAQLKERKFFMGCWAELDLKRPNLCGTAACALGTAAFDLTCNADGLMMQASYSVDGETHEWYLTNTAAWDRAFAALADGLDVELTPEYAGQQGFSAGAEYYDINMEQSNYLFDSGQYVIASRSIRPQDVIEHVRHVLDGHLDDAGLEPDEMYEECMVTPDDPDDSQARPTEGFV